MRKLIVFNHVSIDGYFCDQNGEMNWGRADDPEFLEFVEKNATGGGMLVFGRKTYDMMASFWPTPMAHQSFPTIAERMNNLPKVVFSTTLKDVAWKNTTLLQGDPVVEIRRVKHEPGPDMAILGSGSVVALLAPEGLIDEYQFLISPIVLGQGRTMFEGIKGHVSLWPTSTRVFSNGKIFLCYRPA